MTLLINQKDLLDSNLLSKNWILETHAVKINHQNHKKTNQPNQNLQNKYIKISKNKKREKDKDKDKENRYYGNKD